MARWNDLSVALNTLREIDVTAIRAEAERPLTIVCVGAPGVCQTIAARLESGPQRYGATGPSPVRLASLQTIVPDELRDVDLIIIGLDHNVRLSARELATIDRLALLALPTVLVVWGTTLPPDAGPLHPRVAHARLLVVPDPAASDVNAQLAEAVLDRLPADLHLAAARRLPGLRAVVARNLINSVAFTNASYVLATAVPAQIPLFNIPFAAADILVLTKNQAILVYRLGLAYGAPPDLRERLREVLPVIGGAFIWRQLARALVGLIPVWGIAPKVAIAYAGTYTTGMAAWRWFAEGELVDQGRLRELGQEALELGKARAAELIAAVRATGARQMSRWQRFRASLRKSLQRNRKQPG
ncbi:hypothetical protein [Chloroflexus sp.]|uniref:hypothetical protein n=1 Tax=Chloroflexus sp. TaxID=1904827 RepID=UPI0026273015|nr:hypothetical protein [uncultured Chloroflexus sp.]